MKLIHNHLSIAGRLPAAFGRLCVETFTAERHINDRIQPPSGGCVLKLISQKQNILEISQPPSGGCVLKHQYIDGEQRDTDTSRLRAAVC